MCYIRFRDLGVKRELKREGSHYSQLSSPFTRRAAATNEQKRTDGGPKIDSTWHDFRYILNGVSLFGPLSLSLSIFALSITAAANVRLLAQSANLEELIAIAAEWHGQFKECQVRGSISTASIGFHDLFFGFLLFQDCFLLKVIFVLKIVGYMTWELFEPSRGRSWSCRSASSGFQPFIFAVQDGFRRKIL